ncbi:MAG: DUF2236 domain-containing protein [Sandaracinaceae bacterium]|nr:DUF2236 domain-containing protein [Sandaracinaceae bacterium]
MVIAGPRFDLDETLREIRARTRDPRDGVYGPGSVSWQVNREIAILLGGGRAALLQLCHPYVAYAIDQHSDTPQDPVGRFRRTFEHVFAMVFGDLDTAERSARGVYAIHKRVKGPIVEAVGPYVAGHRYHALDRSALLWVHATLVDSALTVYESAIGPLSRSDRERYYEESRVFASLFGVPPSSSPESFTRFQEYFADTLASSTLTASRPCRALAGFLLQPPRPLYAPLTRWYRVVTAGMLTDRLRRELELPWGPLERASHAASWPAIRAVVARLPARARYFPAYVEAIDRIQGHARADRVGRLLEGAALTAIQPTRSVLAREAARRAG